jgi:hypothetical protein
MDDETRDSCFLIPEVRRIISMEADSMKKQKEGTSNYAKGGSEYSRRSILLGSAALLAGGLVGRISNAYAAPEPKYAPAPPLPWKWPMLDPMEAGTRAYENYLKNKG